MITNANASKDEIIKEITKELINRGKLVELGWQILRISAIDPEASSAQVDDMRTAFFAGAQHVFASILAMLESEDEPTEGDISRMTMIHNELNKFSKEFRLRFTPPKGTA